LLTIFFTQSEIRHWTQTSTAGCLGQQYCFNFTKRSNEGWRWTLRILTMIGKLFITSLTTQHTRECNVATSRAGRPTAVHQNEAKDNRECSHAFNFDV